MGGQWWRDPFLMRRVARWSLLPLALLAALCAVVGGLFSGLFVMLIIIALPVAAFYEARGSLIVLEYASSAFAPATKKPKWLPWLGALVGGVVVVIAFGWIAGRLPQPWSDMLTAAALTTGAGLFLGGFFTLLGYYLDRELVAWVGRAGEEEMRAYEEHERQRGREG